MLAVAENVARIVNGCTGTQLRVQGAQVDEIRVVHRIIRRQYNVVLHTISVLNLIAPPAFLNTKAPSLSEISHSLSVARLSRSGMFLRLLLRRGAAVTAHVSVTAQIGTSTWRYLKGDARAGSPEHPELIELKWNRWLPASDHYYHNLKRVKERKCTAGARQGAVVR